MKQQIPLYLLVAGTGIIIGLLLHRPAGESGDTKIPTQSQPSPATNNIPETTGRQPANNSFDTSSQLNAINTQLDDLLELVEQETQERKLLTQEVNTLKKNIAALTSVDNDKNVHNRSRTFRTNPRNTNTQQRKWFNDQALLDAGVDESEATRIRQMYEDVEMQKLYLRDQAIRDGSMGSQGYREKRAELDNQLESLRNELGEDVYDAYLYAAGQPNRVIVLSALKNSPASESGMQAGDTILRYDNQRIFSWSDLRTATTKGDINTSVMIEIIRDGKPVTIYAPRGPLGIQLDNSSVAP